MEVLAMLDCKKYLTDLGFGIISISLLIFYTEATPFFLSQNERTATWRFTHPATFMKWSV